MRTNADTDLLKSPFIMRVLSIFVNEGIESLRNDGAAKKQKGSSSFEYKSFNDSLKMILCVDQPRIKNTKICINTEKPHT